MKFLIVEDENCVCDVLTRALEGLGYSCLRAGDIPSAQQMLRDNDVQALTVDLGLPGEQTGLDLLESVAREAPDYLEWILGTDFPSDALQLVRGALNGEFPRRPQPRKTAPPAGSPSE